MRVRTLVIGYILIALFSGWPIVSVVIAGTIASRNGCTLHEGFPNPCVVNGKDMGETLYAMGVMGWFMLATIPLGAISFVVWTLVWVFVRKRKEARAAAEPTGLRDTETQSN